MTDPVSRPFHIDLAARRLEVGGESVLLGARAFDVLAYLQTHGDRVVSKQELLDGVWNGLAVEEGNLTVQISALRKILGPRAISTVPGVGYKLTAGSEPAPTPKGPDLPDKPSLAVLPFANLTRQPDNDYLVDGIVSDLVSSLSRIPGIFVIATSSSFHYKGKAVVLADVGAELGVRYVLEGSIQLGGNRLRITTQLVEAGNGHTIWTERFEGSTEDVFDLQDQIAQRTAGALEVKLILAEADRARTKPTDSVQAYDLCLQAAPLVFRVATREVFQAAVALLDQALALDPDYRQAKSLKVRAFMMAAGARAITYEEGREGLQLAQDLLDGRTDDPVVLANAGHMMAYLGRKPELGHKVLQRADALNPNSVHVLASAAWVADYLGRYEAAMGYCERAYRLNPLHPNTAHARSAHGYALIGLGRYDEAVTVLEAANAEDPGFGSTQHALIVACELAGQHDKALEISALYRTANPDYTIRTFQENSPFTDPVFRSRVVEAFRKVGHPD